MWGNSMKIRRDFVTNSSSSSYICVAKVHKTDELLKYFREEYGNYGLRLLDEYLISGTEIKNSEYDYNFLKEYCKDNNVEIENEGLYLKARFINWSTEDDKEEDDAWLYAHIPHQYAELIYEEEYC
jgi:hypothetical protein